MHFGALHYVILLLCCCTVNMHDVDHLSMENIATKCQGVLQPWSVVTLVVGVFCISFVGPPSTGQVSMGYNSKHIS